MMIGHKGSKFFLVGLGARNTSKLDFQRDRLGRRRWRGGDVDLDVLVLHEIDQVIEFQQHLLGISSPRFDPELSSRLVGWVVGMVELGWGGPLEAELAHG